MFTGDLVSMLDRRFFVDCPEEGGSQPVCNIGNKLPVNMVPYPRRLLRNLKSHVSNVLSHRFPQWAHGYWQHMYIEGNTLTYKDHSTFKTFTIRCLGPDLGVSERFPVFARSQW